MDSVPSASRANRPVLMTTEDHEGVRMFAETMIWCALWLVVLAPIAWLMGGL